MKNILQQEYSSADISLMVLVVLFFIIQLYYFGLYYGRVARQRPTPLRSGVIEPISVVVVVHDDEEWVESVLPQLLAQQYERFEVVVVDMGESIEVASRLAQLSSIYTHLTVTRFKYDPKFPISNKMAYNVGIKGASYENLLLTTTMARPASEKWIMAMSDGFSRGSVVLGYCGMEMNANRFAERMVRTSQLMLNVRFAAAALVGNAYRGNLQNLGLKRSLYFEHKGFNFLNMNIGEDDLFIRRIVTADNCALVFNEHSKVIMSVYGGVMAWRSFRRFRDYAVRFYPTGVKFSFSFEQIIRAMFYLSVVATVVLAPVLMGVAAVVLALLRLSLVMVVLRRICRKIGERKLIGTYPIYDICAPLDHLIQFLIRRFAPASGVWR